MNNHINKRMKLAILILLMFLVAMMSIHGTTTSVAKSSEGKEKQQPTPRHVRFQNKNIGLIPYHFQIVKDFDQTSIYSLNVSYTRDNTRPVTTVTVINKKFQILVYRVSTGNTDRSNQVIPFRKNVYYKLYEYDSKLNYSNPDTYKTRKLLKSIRHYGANGSPYSSNGGPFSFRVVYHIRKLKPTILALMTLEEQATKDKHSTKIPNNLISVEHFNSKGAFKHKKHISTHKYWNLTRHPAYPDYFD